ncbi:hypothetical protein CHU98_g8314 [Xylaria longipes]|nr:hypothetical protein CHU98_g8314 [Xylaria longipes]
MKKRLAPRPPASESPWLIVVLGLGRVVYDAPNTEVPSFQLSVLPNSNGYAPSIITYAPGDVTDRRILLREIDYFETGLGLFTVLEVLKGLEEPCLPP